MGLRITPLTGAALARALPEVARLRIAVFAEWPYLYDGDLAYEERYLQSYRDSDRAIVVGAFDGERLVGASTGMPLTDHADDFAAAFAPSGINLSEVFYCAESVLLPGYRGQGIGHRFFDARERHARTQGFSRCCFCAVIRPEDHPARPTGYRPLDAFWRGRGYQPLDGVVAAFHWKDQGESKETPKPLQFWIRDL
ncbi:GNAT family N-acetyltransferase [Sulfitobacter sp. G21635-S1]|uniref:GNAT family N-acetyltransferase n=1 Tax=Sulfitobacter sp. G21635-S1 TaxID=3014043 RepID=UPI0022AE5977|nr:GNAT family N-acetyltransferase [Sulfitobacter sp. G21635-S1]MCZ4258863.1 GNAT family N-acetyltransferase [Sulfitobacter sp. G21635-S1]